MQDIKLSTNCRRTWLVRDAHTTNWKFEAHRNAGHPELYP